MKTLLEARNLAYKYSGGVTALDGVDFSLEPGGSLALIGANGAGKSTLMQLLVGILEPCGGELLFQSKPVTRRKLPFLREKIGLVFQNADHQLFCNTVYEDVIFGPLNMGLDPTEAEARAAAALNALSIRHLARRAPYRLSAGEKRLAAIASVISMQPEILLMDEPTAELDPRARRELIALLAGLPQSKIIATHDLDFAAKTCPRTILLHNGKIAQSGLSPDILGDDGLLRKFGL